MVNGHEQALRAQQPRGDLSPRLRAGTVDEATAPSGEGRCCGRHVSDLELNAGLGARVSAGHSVNARKQADTLSEGARGQSALSHQARG